MQGNNLENHMISHKRVQSNFDCQPKMFSCDYCSYVSKRRYDVKTHIMRMHKNEEVQEDVNADGIYDRALKMERLDDEFKRKMELGRKAKEILEQNDKYRLINKFKVLKEAIDLYNNCMIWQEL